MRQSKLTYTASLILLGSVCGCGPYPGTKADPPPLEAHENLIYLDSALTGQIPCEKLSAERLPSGRLRIYARFYNKQNHTAETQVKIKFKDDKGRTIDQTGWTPFLVPRRESTQFEHTSLTDKATDFVFMLRKIKQ